MNPDMLLPVTVHNLLAYFAFQPDGQLREKVRHGVKMGVVRVIAGPEKCHVIVDVKRPYFRPAALLPDPRTAKKIAHSGRSVC